MKDMIPEFRFAPICASKKDAFRFPLFKNKLFFSLPANLEPLPTTDTFIMFVFEIFSGLNEM